VGDRYRTPGGWTVEVVQLAAGDRLHIRRHGFYVADVLSVDDLARAARPEAVRHRSAGVCAPAPSQSATLCNDAASSGCCGGDAPAD